MMEWGDRKGGLPAMAVTIAVFEGGHSTIKMPDSMDP